MSEGQNPQDLVKGPGLGLLIVGILGICLGLFGLLSSLLGFGAAHVQEMQDQGQQLPEWSKYLMGGGGALQIVFNVIFIAANAFVAFGGLQMQKLQSRSVCMIAAILAMIPCSPCCLLGLPIGIWALIALNKPEVRAGFGSPTS